MTVDDATLLSQPITLPCGTTVPNRLVKAAMYEHLAGAGGGPPNEKHCRLYELWAKGGWGVILTGNVQVSSTHLSLGADAVIPQSGSPLDLEPWKRFAEAIHASNSASERPLAVMQLSHSGRQSPRFVGGRWPWVRALAPSGKRLGSDKKVGFLGDLVFKIGFDIPKPMTRADIDWAIKQFVHGATVAWKAGFDGVELHASHGYLISQFVSRKTNLRTDEHAEPLRFLRDIVLAIREIVPSTFVVGVKLNSGDYVHGGFSEEHGLEHVRAISGWNMIDFIEVSGGDYEDPRFGQVTTRQAFFSSFSRKALEVARSSSSSPPLIILTGSLRARKVMASSIRDGHTQLIGIGRPSVLHPAFASALQNPSLGDEDVQPPTEPDVPDLRISPLIGSGLGTLWYCWAMAQLVKRREADVRAMPWFALLQMSFGVDPFDGWKVLFVSSVAAGLSYWYLFVWTPASLRPT